MKNAFYFVVILLAGEAEEDEDREEEGTEEDEEEGGGSPARVGLVFFNEDWPRLCIVCFLIIPTWNSFYCVKARNINEHLVAIPLLSFCRACQCTCLHMIFSLAHDFPQR